MLGLQQLLGMPLCVGGTFLRPPQLPSRLQWPCAGSILEAESHLDGLSLSRVWRVLVCSSTQISGAAGVVRLALILGCSSPEEHLLFSGFLSCLPVPCALKFPSPLTRTRSRVHLWSLEGSGTPGGDSLQGWQRGMRCELQHSTQLF